MCLDAMLLPDQTRDILSGFLDQAYREIRENEIGGNARPYEPSSALRNLFSGLAEHGIEHALPQIQAVAEEFAFGGQQYDQHEIG